MNHEMFDGGGLPFDLNDRVQSEMRDGERLLWTGQPKASRAALAALPLVLFGIPFTAFSLVWMVTASGILFAGINHVDPPGGFGLFACFPLFGLPFLVIGVGMLSSPYWIWRQAKMTCYALTDRRAILWQAGKFGGVEVRSYGQAALGKVVRTEYSDGCGDLVFEEIVSIGTDGDGHRSTSTTRHGFMAIRNVRDVEDLLRKAMSPSHGDERFQ